MDQYSFRLLEDMCNAVDKDGDGCIDPEEIRETLQVAKGAPISGPEELLQAVTMVPRLNRIMLIGVRC